MLFQNSVPAMLPAQAETLNKLHKLRWLLWRGKMW